MLSKTSIVWALVLVVIGLGASLAATPPAWGQCSWEMFYTFTGEAAGNFFGYSVSGAGDVDNDGYDDLIVGAHHNGAGGNSAGRAYVYSGQTGGLLWTFTGQAQYDFFGYSVSGAGDVDNDGHDDLIVGAIGNDAGGTGAGRAYVYSGQTGALLWTFTGAAAQDRLGHSVSGAGDVNNDGYADLIVGAPENESAGDLAGRAYVYSGQTGALLWTFTGEGENYYLGGSVSGAGDVNDDGYDDLIVGAPSMCIFPPCSSGWAYVYSGQTGTLLWTFAGEAEGDEFGSSVSGAGDVNNDGYDDLIVGAHLNETGGSLAGRAYVYSGQTGALLWTFTGQAAGDQLGCSVSGAGDQNNDGYDDLMVGAFVNDAGGTDAGRVYVYSGQSGVVLQTLTGHTAGEWFGYSVSGAGDVNNDGYYDLIVGAHYNDAGGADAGRVYVYSGATGMVCFTGEAVMDCFGFSVSGAGDVDNDGYDDLIVGAPNNGAAGDRAGRAYAYSGQTSALLWTFTGEGEYDYFGTSVSKAGDVDNDGYDDLIVGAYWNDAGGYQAGRAYVYSGQTGGLLWTFTAEAADNQFGYSVSGAGDVNNDGYDDLAVGAPYNDAGGIYAGRAYVYSGQTGGLLWTHTAEAAYDEFGRSVSGAGDVDNDGHDDLIVGAPLNDAGGDNAGRAYVYSGQTGAVLQTFTGEATGDWFGHSVSGAGDVDDDGYVDLIVGARNSSAGGTYAGRAYVFSGQTGALLQTFTGEAEWDRLGWSVSGAGDVNDDGYDELIVGAYANDAGGTDAGRAYVYSGRSGALLCTFDGQAADDYFGASVSGAGDVNDDRYAELIVGAPNAGDNSTGRAYVLSCQVEDPFVRGDANGDGIINVGDIVFLVTYLYKSGPAPDPLWVGDANCDGIINVGDIVYLVSYLYKGGPEPGC